MHLLDSSRRYTARIQRGHRQTPGWLIPGSQANQDDLCASLHEQGTDNAATYCESNQQEVMCTVADISARSYGNRGLTSGKPDDRARFLSFWATQNCYLVGHFTTAALIGGLPARRRPLALVFKARQCTAPLVVTVHQARSTPENALTASLITGLPLQSWL